MKLLQDAEWSHWSDREIVEARKGRRRRSSGPDALEVPRQDAHGGRAR
jgi:hypothetical protein